jgi:solute carrier family 25 carnitine/acylcarnitine transporter 20/29
MTGAAGLVVGQPFDVVEVRYQTPRFAGQYTSTWGALSGSDIELLMIGAIVREEKVRHSIPG